MLPNVYIFIVICISLTYTQLPTVATVTDSFQTLPKLKIITSQATYMVYTESDYYLPALSSESTPLQSSSNSNDCSSPSSGGVPAAETEVKLASQTPKRRAGRKKFRETRHPVYRGVRLRDNGKWVCEVREPNTKFRVWLGTHPTAIMAARAHDVAALAFRGQSACLNFADSVWRLPIPNSSSIQEIQKAAAEAAEAFRHKELEAVPEIVELPEVRVYEDEEEIYEMPGFFASMAEGLMVPPPQTVVGYENNRDNMEFSDNESLWSL